jgi:hypothetical protein
MKKFTTDEIRDLFNQVMLGEISFSEMVEVMNEMVDEKNEPQYKDGDFVIDEVGGILIFRKKVGDSIYNHAYFYEPLGVVIIAGLPTWPSIKRLATEEEKQKLLDALEKDGKRWNEEKKCVEDMPKRKFKAGDKVKIKDGISSETHSEVGPGFVDTMDKFIGKELTVENCSESGFVTCDGYYFSEDWLEPYEELKEGDLAIFWDDDKNAAVIGKYGKFTAGQPFPHSNHREHIWKNALKFESKEQYKKLLKGEI